jgi:hypothetical protein
MLAAWGYQRSQIDQKLTWFSLLEQIKKKLSKFSLLERLFARF